jgi:phosphomannomutase
MAARPSGTEPKIKFYFSVNGPMNSLDEAKEAESRLDQKIRDIIKEFNL